MTQTRDLIKKIADFFTSEEFYEKGEDATLELSSDDVRCVNELIHHMSKIRAEIEQEYNRLRATRADETLELGECLGLKMSLKFIDKYR